MKIKRKNKIRLIGFLIISIILFTSFKPINVLSVDDNYSTYLYNQNINVDNDKAHLLSEQSDGSNSYRNIFQSNFLFPAKLQNSMLSTFQTSSFSHYSFNQFYFDNLDNNYAYQSNDNSENFETSIIPNEFDVINGTNIVNGSLEKQDSSFGKYNATYSFDDYQETESNYGNYYMSEYDDFNNETIGNTNLNIKWIDFLVGNPNATIVNYIENHKNVLSFQNSYVIHTIDYTKSEIFEFYTNIPDNTKNTGIIFSEGFLSCLILKTSYYDGYFEYYNGSQYIEVQSVINYNWYYHKIIIQSDNSFSWYINGILKVDNMNLGNNMTNGINRIYLYSQDFNHILNIDAFGIVNDDDSYNENDNTNSYGLQTELENDNFEIDYSYNTSILIDNIDNYQNNIIRINDNHITNDLKLKNIFNDKEIGNVEFSFNISNSQQELQFNLLYNDFSTFHMKVEYGLIAYWHTSNWHNSDSKISIENNKWYNVRIKFNTIIDKCNISINNNEIDNNVLFNTNRIAINSFDFYTNGNNFISEIDNIDYSWDNDYYENRIQDLIPLNDSNYNMYKAFEKQKAFGVYPNQDISTQWSNYPVLQEHYDCINYYDYGLNNSEFLQASSNNLIDIFGFNNEIIERNIQLIEVSVQAYKYLDVGSNDFYIRLYNGLEYTEYNILTIENIGILYNFTTIFEINYNQTEINDLELTLKSFNNHAGSSLYILSLNISAYYSYRNIELISQKNIVYNLNEIYKPVLHTLYYSLSSSINKSINIYIYNYDLSQYYLINSFYQNFSFSEFSFILNESAYFRFNIFKLKIISKSLDFFDLFIDKLSLNITYIIQNNEGYQEIIAYNHRYDNSNNYKGYSRFELLIYNDSIKYRYSEINFEQNDYIYAWITYNTSNIDVKNIELQSHVRYGLNTLDIEIINFYYIIYINYNDDYTIEFREQSRKELETHKIKSSFNYTSYTRNYLDLTGIIGNYSYNTFKGCRNLYGATTEIFHRNFQIPYFSDDIDVSIPLILPDDDFSNPDEPEPPTQYYWEYETFKTEYYQDININIGNWTVQFSQMRSTVYKAKYFYQPESINRDDLGSWKWKIKFTDAFSYTVDFNFLRNAVISILNLILLFSQWIGYLLVASLSYIFMYLGTTILVFLWNTLVYALFYALIYIMWYLYLGIYMLLYYIWEGLIWVYENLLIPFFEWFWNEAIPWIIDFIIIILAHIITLVIFAITLGQIDYDSTYDTVYLMLRYIADEIIEAIIVFTKHLNYILLFVLYYLLLIGLLYIRYVYVKARGFNNRAEQLHKAFEVFSMPIVWTIDLFRETKELVNPYS